MWTVIARIILRNKILLLLGVALATAFMGFKASEIKISYQFARILPIDDTVNIQYQDFLKTFGAAGNTIVMGTEDEDFFTPGRLALWDALAREIADIPGIENVLSVTKTYDLALDSNDVLQPIPFVEVLPRTQDEANALKQKLLSRPFYKGLLYTREGEVNLMMVNLAKDQLYNKNIIRIVEAVKEISDNFERETQIEVHVSGLPYIRMANTQKLKNEVYLFIFLTIATTAILLLVFLKSFRAMLIALTVVVIGVAFSFGLISSLGFSITLLSSLIPPLVIVIGIPNCIFLINKYHSEYKEHGGKILALHRVIRKVGNVTLITNVTTALGFAAFILTESQALVEFGIVASLNILVVFVISIILIPIIYTYLTPPKERHYNHLDKKWLNEMISTLTWSVQHARPLVYILSFVVAVGAIYGISKIETTGNLTEDFSKDDPVFQDVKFMEAQFKGVIPIEIIIDTHKAKGVQKASTLKRMDKLQATLDTFPNISRSLSMVDFVKSATQAFFDNDPSFYRLPTSNERAFVYSSLPKVDGANVSLLSSLVDSIGQKGRITMQLADISTPEMKILERQITDIVMDIFPKEKYEVTITGASVVFLKGTDYLIKNLIISLALAVFVIAIIMAFLFGSIRMVFISLLPNIIPLLVTGGLMGYFGIPIKPSTILVFSIAFGISVDDTIHYLAKYRQELKANGWKIGPAALASIRETGVSMFYTSVVLFSGFSIFIWSEFGGTIALGILVSLTLFVAMVSNLVLLPSLLMSLERFVTSREFNENLIEIYEGESEEDESLENEHTQS